jgi:tetratricopeptide (TPR) repeat protein
MGLAMDAQLRHGRVMIAGGILLVLLTGLFLSIRSGNSNTSNLRPVELSAPLVSSESVPATPSAQKARVESLLAKGDFESALSEAQIYYNAAPLKETHKAIEYIATALAQTRGKSDPTLVGRFLEQQSLGARTASGKVRGEPVLPRASADPARYTDALERTKNASTYAELISRGDLLLLAGQPQEARQAFLAACKLAKVNNKQLFDAVEGVARAIRAEDGVSGRANALVLTLMLGEQLPAEMQGTLDDLFARGELQVAGQRVSLPQLSKRAAAGTPSASPEQAGDDSDAPSATAGFETFDLGDPVVIAAVAPQPDGELIAWLLRWHVEANAGRFGISDDEQIVLRKILARTDTPCLTLLHLGHAFQFRAGDGSPFVPAQFYAAVADRLDLELQFHGESAHAVAILRGIKDHMGGFKSVLWPLIESGDKRALGALYTIYCSYVQWAPPADKAIAKPVLHMRIGIAECLHLMGKTEDAIASLAALDPGVMDKGELATHQWVYGLLLYRSDRFAESIPYFKAVASINSGYSQAASANLILAAIEAGEVQVAREAYESHKGKYGFRPGNAELLDYQIRQAAAQRAAGSP